MTIRANYDPRYFRRFLYIAIGCIGFALWFFYDAVVGYPSELERANVYWTPSDDPGKKYDPMVRDEWRTVVAENGWPTASPRKPDKLKNAIQGQYFYGGFCAVLAIPCLLKWGLAKGSWVEGTESGLTTSWGPALQCKEITSIDKTKWENKGITRIHYQQDGNDKTFKFDDFKFQREPMGDILEMIEKSLSDDQITGGDRESVIRQRRKEARAEAEGEIAMETKQLASDHEEAMVDGD
ncbi:MAG: hypothetical protein ACR2NP_15605 [Pirellulaceae bacterium]